MKSSIADEVDKQLKKRKIENRIAQMHVENVPDEQKKEIYRQVMNLEARIADLLAENKKRDLHQADLILKKRSAEFQLATLERNYAVLSSTNTKLQMRLDEQVKDLQSVKSNMLQKNIELTKQIEAQK